MRFDKIRTKLLAMYLFVINTIPAYAADGTAAANELVGLLKVLMGYVQKVGFVLVAYGIGKMVLAFKDDNAESKARGSMILLAGVFCVVIKTILEQLGAFPAGV